MKNLANSQLFLLLQENNFSQKDLKSSFEDFRNTLINICDMEKDTRKILRMLDYLRSHLTILDNEIRQSGIDKKKCGDTIILC